MGVKDKLFRWGLSRQLKRIPVDGDLVVTPDAIVIPLQFVEKPVVFKIDWPTPSWSKIIPLVIEEVFMCLRYRLR